MKIILVDLDSTVTRKVHRHHYQWERVDEDEPIPEMIKLVKNYPAEIVILTARNEGYNPTPKIKDRFPTLTDHQIKNIGRRETEKWVKREIGEVHSIIMKPFNSYENSAEFKYREITKLIESGYDIDFLLDDNESVCKTVSASGLINVLQFTFS